MGCIRNPYFIIVIIFFYCLIQTLKCGLDSWVAWMILLSMDISFPSKVWVIYTVPHLNCHNKTSSLGIQETCILAMYHLTVNSRTATEKVKTWKSCPQTVVQALPVTLNNIMSTSVAHNSEVTAWSLILNVFSCDKEMCSFILSIYIFYYKEETRSTQSCKIELMIFNPRKVTSILHIKYLQKRGLFKCVT